MVIVPGLVGEFYCTKILIIIISELTLCSTMHSSANPPSAASPNTLSPCQEIQTKKCYPFVIVQSQHFSQSSPHWNFHFITWEGSTWMGCSYITQVTLATGLSYIPVNHTVRYPFWGMRGVFANIVITFDSCFTPSPVSITTPAISLPTNTGKTN